MTKLYFTTIHSLFLYTSVISQNRNIKGCYYRMEKIFEEIETNLNCNKILKKH
jgi:hypothetical protein